MARPRTRTAVLDPEELGLFQGTFGSCTFAYQQLRSPVSYPSFQRLWVGKSVTVVERDQVRRAWDEYVVRQLMVLRESVKKSVGEMYTPGGSPVVESPRPFEEPAA